MSLFDPETSGGSSKKLKLYSYWRSSCAFRVRIGLNLKEFLKLNPIGYVPVLVDGDIVIADSFAIFMYLEEAYPQHPLLPRDIQKKALNYQKYIEEKVGPDEKIPWVQHHIRKGFTALEKLLKDHAGKYATGDEIFLTPFPVLLRLHEAYSKHEAFKKALPENQPDAPTQH
ncbi:hypothetical protein Tsubulata_003380 [Turnera subulata]|uniref:GST N-terminal domain-containing protein n=1 Tax=Turnera subulata TaxID=218843 RepID=A0A9Q0GH66_9ROSI|nr:hypothetical protein Tsubulata_003380 [Turnera subulata]